MGVWRKKGLIFVPPGSPAWLTSHATVPTTDPLADGRVAVYFSSRDEKGRGQIGRFDFDPSDPEPNSTLHPEPVLRLGATGTFDDNGLTPSCIVSDNETKYLYYTGWNLGVTVPFYLNVGLAISADGGETFERVREGPIMGRDKHEPYLTASPCVLRENGVWRMWYSSGVRWQTEDNGKPKHFYHIKYAESSDGIHWGSERPVCIDFSSPDEYAIARACVRRNAGSYQMWYCYRGSAYQIGYAESPDGIRWTRQDALAGIAGSDDGWDSGMQAYPWVFSHCENTYMLYNGTDYGKTGIGMAVSDRTGR